MPILSKNKKDDVIFVLFFVILYGLCDEYTAERSKTIPNYHR